MILFLNSIDDLKYPTFLEMVSSTISKNIGDFKSSIELRNSILQTCLHESAIAK